MLPRASPKPEFLLTSIGSPADRPSRPVNPNPSVLDGISTRSTSAIHKTSHLQTVCRNAQINKPLSNLLMFSLGCSHKIKASVRQGTNRSCCNVKSLHLKIFGITTTKNQNIALFSVDRNFLNIEKSSKTPGVNEKTSFLHQLRYPRKALVNLGPMPTTKSAIWQSSTSLRCFCSPVEIGFS